MPKKGTTDSTSTRIGTALHKRVIELAKLNETTKSKVIRALLREGIRYMRATNPLDRPAELYWMDKDEKREEADSE